MVTLLVGCGKKPEETVNEFLTAMKSGDYATAQKLTTSEITTLKEGIEQEPEFIKALLERMSYKVLEPTSEGGKAQVEVEFTAVDIAPIMEEAMAEMITLMLGELDGASDEVLEAKLRSIVMDMVKDPAAQMTTAKVTLELEKAGGDWKIAVNENNEVALADALTGGYATALAEMDSDE
jgi:hypothetical protein